MPERRLATSVGVLDTSSGSVPPSRAVSLPRQHHDSGWTQTLIFERLQNAIPYFVTKFFILYTEELLHLLWK